MNDIFSSITKRNSFMLVALLSFDKSSIFVFERVQNAPQMQNEVRKFHAYYFSGKNQTNSLNHRAGIELQRLRYVGVGRLEKRDRSIICSPEWSIHLYMETAHLSLQFICSFDFIPRDSYTEGTKIFRLNTQLLVAILDSKNGFVTLVHIYD